MKPYLSIIIPAYNEGERIIPTLEDIDRKLRDVDFSYEIIVVSDGSKDNTADVVRKTGERVKNIRVIDHDQNKGKGGVVREGMLESRGEIRLFTDADNTTSIDHFFKMKPLFNKGYDVVICDRTLRGSELDPPQPIYRQIPGKIGNIIIQALLLPGISDTQCGFKAFSANAAKDIFSKSKITGFGFDIEALSLAKKMGYKVGRVPVHWVNDLRSHVKASAYLKVLRDTFKIRWWLFTNRYKIKNIEH